MNRRQYLGGLGGVGAVATAGCLGFFGEEERAANTVLSEQGDFPGNPEDFSYPAYGERLPDITLPDPLTDEPVHIAESDRVTVLTTFFAACPEECGILINNLAGAQASTIEGGFADDVRFLAITFDPERDDAERLRDNASLYGVDLDVGNWRYLRPESPSEAESVVTDELGVPFERVDESDRLPTYDFSHIVITTLANPGGVVERVYQGENFDRERLAEDAKNVAEGYEPEAAE